MDISFKTTHVAESLARLKEQFKDKAKVEALIGILSARTQALETAFSEQYAQTQLANAVGAMLDRAGKKVGQPRLAFDDDAYRLTIQGRIRANRSRGTIDAIHSVLLAVLPDLTWEILEDALAAYTSEADEPLTATQARVIKALLAIATPAGVKAQLVWQEYAPAETFACAVAIPLNGGESAGATTVDVHTSTAGFPTSGTIMISAGTSLEESKAYTGKTATTFTGVTALANNHPDGAMVTLVGGAGLGFALGTPLDGTEAIGETVLTVDDTTGFDAAGDLEIDAGTSIYEPGTYAALTGTTFTLDDPTTYEHTAGSMITQGGGRFANTETV